MKYERIDTDGIFDRCSECGGFVRVKCDTQRQPRSWDVGCCDCANSIPPQFSESRAMEVWNKEQRNQHGGSHGEVH
jgi:hypothetical protein